MIYKLQLVSIDQIHQQPPPERFILSKNKLGQQKSNQYSLYTNNCMDLEQRKQHPETTVPTTIESKNSTIKL